MNNAGNYRCFEVRKSDAGDISSSVVTRQIESLPHVDTPNMRIRVHYSALNYKDALAATGHPGIVRHFPHVPGIDAVGEVLESSDADFAPGDSVIVTGHDLGVNHDGAWADQIRVPASWGVRLPDGLSPQQAIILGTAGFTAAQCVEALQAHSIRPETGEIVVTGATGGVASCAILILAKLGYKVVGVTGKPDQHDSLRDLGASRFIDRNDFSDDSGRPLLSSEFAGGIDTVGGRTLETLLRRVGYRGCIAACGLAGGHELNMTVYPFLLRGVTLAGIDSAMCPDGLRQEIWEKLSDPWKPNNLERLATEVSMAELPSAIDSILAGSHTGRTILRLN